MAEHTATGDHLTPESWPPYLGVELDELVFDGCGLSSIAERYGTPNWVLSLRVVRENFRRFQETWQAHYPSVECAYSMKANNTTEIIRLLASLGSTMDCTGETEFRIAMMCGVPAARIIVNGNGKSRQVLTMAARHGARQVNVDSIGEAQRLNAIAAEEGTVVDCVVRVQLGYERLLELDPAYTPMARIWEGKFGVNVPSGEALRGVDYIASASNLRFRGLHHHVGFSGVSAGYRPDLDVMHHAECARELVEFSDLVTRQLGVDVERLDLGGGFPSGRSVYLATPGNQGDGARHPLPATDAYAEVITEAVRDHFAADKLPVLQFETGRYQVANAATLIASVTDVKDHHSAPPRRFISVDTSMQQFTSKGFTNTAFEVVPVKGPLAAENGLLADIVGQTCAYDSVAEDIELPDIEPGDLIAVLGQGAYGDTTGTNMNAMPRPGVVVVDDGRAAIAKRPETTMDIVARYAGPDLDWRELS